MISSHANIVGMQLSVDDCAAVANCGRDTIKRAIERGELKAWWLNTGRKTKNKRWRVRGEDLLDWMRRNSNRQN